MLTFVWRHAVGTSVRVLGVGGGGGETEIITFSYNDSSNWKLYEHPVNCNSYIPVNAQRKIKQLLNIHILYTSLGTVLHVYTHGHLHCSKTHATLPHLLTVYVYIQSHPPQYSN